MAKRERERERMEMTMFEKVSIFYETPCISFMWYGLPDMVTGYRFLWSLSLFLLDRFCSYFTVQTHIMRTDMDGCSIWWEGPIISTSLHQNFTYLDCFQLQRYNRHEAWTQLLDTERHFPNHSWGFSWWLCHWHPWLCPTTIVHCNPPRHCKVLV